MKNPPVTSVGWRYSTPAIVMHWLIAACIVFMATLGWWMMTVEHEPGGQRWMDLHKSVGLIVFALVVLRLALRLLHKPAPLPGGMPAWEVQMAHLTQWLLYAVIVLLPVTGILGASYSRSGLKFFGTPLPAWLGKDRDTAELFFNIHSSLVWVLVALLALHVIGALKHLLFDHDQVFRRMWPRRHS